MRAEMNQLLTSRERQALECICVGANKFTIKGELTAGIGHLTLAGLVRKGLLETGPSAQYDGQTGYRVTPDGWRSCSQRPEGKKPSEPM